MGNIPILPAMTISSSQNSQAVGDVRTAATLTAFKSAVAQQASLLQLFDPAKSVPSPRAADKSDDNPPPPKDSGRGRVVDRQA